MDVSINSVQCYGFLLRRKQVRTMQYRKTVCNKYRCFFLMLLQDTKCHAHVKLIIITRNCDNIFNSNLLMQVINKKLSKIYVTLDRSCCLSYILEEVPHYFSCFKLSNFSSVKRICKKYNINKY